MANHSATKKSIKQTAKRTERNIALKSRIRTYVKKFDEAIAKKDKEALPGLFKQAQSELSKAVTKKILKKETVSRKISRLNASFKKVLAS